MLAADIFYQFFTRYALNDSAAWTEEIARYLLICVVFIALAWAVRDNRHIHVDLFYRYLPARACRALATLVDLVRIVFFAYAVVLTWQMMQKMGSYKMTIVDLPMNTVYAVCAVRLRHRRDPIGAGRGHQLAARLQRARATRIGGAVVSPRALLPRSSR